MKEPAELNMLLYVCSGHEHFILSVEWHAGTFILSFLYRYVGSTPLIIQTNHITPKTTQQPPKLPKLADSRVLGELGPIGWKCPGNCPIQLTEGSTSPMMHAYRAFNTGKDMR